MLSKLRQGVLYVYDDEYRRRLGYGEVDEKELSTRGYGKYPVYLVEMLEDNIEPKVLRVYALQKGSNPPVKAYTEKPIKTGIKPSSKLGRVATDLLKIEEQTVGTRKVDLPPLFITLVEYGKDTFTGKSGYGFYDRQPDTTRTTGETNEPVFKEGALTGVFVTLDSIEWSDPMVASKDIVDKYKAEELMRFSDYSLTPNLKF